MSHCRWVLALCLVVLPSAMAEPLREITVFTSGTEGYSHYRIPSIVRANDGALLAFAEGRKDSGRDHGNIDLVLKRSEDDGLTWGPLQIIADNDIHTIGNPTPIVDRRSGRVILMAMQNHAEDRHAAMVAHKSHDRRRTWMLTSDDHGATWTPKREISHQAMRDHWRWYSFGPHPGIQLERGPQAGRLIAPANFSAGGSDRGGLVLYSDDGGDNWQIGAIAMADSELDLRPAESTAVELVDGRILLNSRNGGEGIRHRANAYSSDAGLTFDRRNKAEDLIEPVSQASVIRFSAVDSGDTRNQLLFSNPASTQRLRFTVRSSFDESETWTQGKMIHRGPSAYGSLIKLDKDRAAVLYEHGLERRYERINLAIFPVQWLEDPTILMVDFNGDVRDNRGNGVAMSVDGEINYVEGDSRYATGKARRFDATSAPVRIPDAPHHILDFEPVDSFTIEALIRTSAHTERERDKSGPIFSKDVAQNQAAYWLRIQNGRLRFLVSDGEKTATVTSRKEPIADGRWRHVAAVRDALSRELRLYVDHKLVAQETDTTTMGFGNENDALIGAFNDSSDGRKIFDGDIDFVRISGGALSPEQFIQPK
jgi:sialidase-1